VLFVHVLLAVLVAVPAWDIVEKAEHWPWGSYRMFAGIADDRLSRRVLFGVDAQGAEVPLHNSDVLHPFDRVRLNDALLPLLTAPGALDVALRDVLDRYESRRRAGAHDGPALRGIRLYEVYWRLDPQARNRDDVTNRTMLAEVGADP
jgi:hypothetical protein